MANHTGSEGTVKIAANVIAEIRNWSIDESGDTIEDTIMGESARTFKAGLTTWTGSLDCWWDETDTTGQGALTIGASVALNVYPEGDTTANIFYAGTALVTGIARNAALDGMVEASFSFQGSGALVEGAVPA